jgi:hypothetical protein
MGLTIHYSGTLRNPELLPSLIREAVDVAESMKWAYEFIHPAPGIPISGVIVAPEGSEPLWLTFHRDGFMCNPVLFEYVLEKEGQEIPADAEQWLFTKTQYAGVEAHIALIHFIRHISQKYFDRFELHDESRYWETSDEALCREIFGKYDEMMDMVGAALDEMEIDPDESQESVIAKIEKMLTERFGMKREH